MSALFFIVSFALVAAAIIQGIRAARGLEEEGRRLGYDFFTLDFSLALFRREQMPPSMRPHFQKMCRVCLSLLLPATGLMFVGFWLEGFYLGR